MNKYSHREGFSKLSSSSKSVLSSISPTKEVNSPSVSLAHKLNTDLLNSALSLKHRKSSSMDFIANYDRQPAISPFTMAQNDIVAESLHRILEDQKAQLWFPDMQSATMLRSDHDFNKLINKLNRVIFPDINKRSVFLSDSEYADFCLDESQAQLCKAYIKGKKTPLIVKIQRFKGKILTYASFYNKEPGPEAFDRFYSSDYFEIRENMQNFKYEYIYFAFKAVEYSEFRVQITFGKISDLNEIKKLKRQLSQLHLGKPSADTSPVIRKPQRSMKDFVSYNKSIKLLSSGIREQELKKRAKKWEVKHKEVIGKKKGILIEKISKNQRFLNRGEIRKQLKNEEMLKKAERDFRLEVQKQWMGVLYFVKALGVIRKKVQDNREKKMKKIDTNIKAIKIQRIFRGFTRDLDVADRALLRARDNLLMYHAFGGTCIKKQVSLKLFKYIVSVAHDYMTSHQLNV